MRAVIVILAFAPCGCGALATSPDASTAEDAAIDATTVDANGCFVCPAALPAQGGACVSIVADASEGCEYGDFTTGACSSLATCTDAGWNLDVPPSPQCANDPSCPSAFDAQAPICALGLRCDYASGRCGCEEMDAGLAWTCEGTEPSCPPTRPRIGSACDGAHECVYGDHGACSDLRGTIVTCDPCGTWQLVPIFVPPCPH
ncbi:MAG TPA: hypothetical protein VGH87_14975 [Polyangiaceae bacterium]